MHVFNSSKNTKYIVPNLNYTHYYFFLIIIIYTLNAYIVNNKIQYYGKNKNKNKLIINTKNQFPQT